MTFSEEQAIKEALRCNDGRLLAQTVKHMNFVDYEEIERFVREVPGTYGNISYQGIEAGNVRIRNKYRRPEVQRI